MIERSTSLIGVVSFAPLSPMANCQNNTKIMSVLHRIGVMRCIHMCMCIYIYIQDRKSVV